MIVTVVSIVVAAVIAGLIGLALERHVAYCWALEGWKRSCAIHAEKDRETADSLKCEIAERKRLQTAVDVAREQRNCAREDANAAVQSEMGRLRADNARLNGIIATLDEQVVELGEIPRRDQPRPITDELPTPCLGPNL